MEQVDGKPVSSIDEAGQRLNGPVDTVVVMTVKRGMVFGSHTFDIKVTRKELAMKKTGSFTSPRQMASPAFSNSSIFDRVHAAVGGGVGLGLDLAKSGSAVAIRAIRKGGGADKTKGKVQVGDVIVEVDDAPAGTTAEAVSKQLTGVRGTTVKLRLRRSGVFGFQVVEVVCTREDEMEVDSAGRIPSSPRTQESDPFQFVSTLAAGIGLGVGIGVEFAIKGSKQCPRIIVTGITPGGPADKDGNLKVGDRLLTVDTKPVAITLEGIRTQIIGERGTHVVLKIERDAFMGAETRVLQIKRGDVAASSRKPNVSENADLERQDDPGFLERAAYIVGLQVKFVAVVAVVLLRDCGPVCQASSFFVHVCVRVYELEAPPPPKVGARADADMSWLSNRLSRVRYVAQKKSSPGRTRDLEGGRKRRMIVNTLPHLLSSSSPPPLLIGILLTAMMMFIPQLCLAASEKGDGWCCPPS